MRTRFAIRHRRGGLRVGGWVVGWTEGNHTIVAVHLYEYALIVSMCLLIDEFLLIGKLRRNLAAPRDGPARALSRCDDGGWLVDVGG